MYIYKISSEESSPVMQTDSALTNTIKLLLSVTLHVILMFLKVEQHF